MAYEKMPCLYDTERDLIDRLHQTICRFQGKAVLVTVETKSSLALFDPVDRSKLLTKIKPNDPDFDISSPELGYMNHDEKVLYVERLPQRRFRQGLTYECCSTYDVTGEGGARPMLSQYMQSSGLVDMIEGRYPKFREAQILLQKGAAKEIAVSRDIAFKMLDCGLILVYCKCHDVGYILPESFDIDYKTTETSWVVDRMLERIGYRKRGKSVWN